MAWALCASHARAGRKSRAKLGPWAAGKREQSEGGMKRTVAWGKRQVARWWAAPAKRGVALEDEGDHAGGVWMRDTWTVQCGGVWMTQERAAAWLGRARRRKERRAGRLAG